MCCDLQFLKEKDEDNISISIHTGGPIRLRYLSIPAVHRLQDYPQGAREEALESKLGVIEAMTACEQYGKQNYRNFKMHSVLGKIAEYASDDDTWFLKYKVDADGYEQLTMECYVTGTSDSPIVKQFTVY